MSDNNFGNTPTVTPSVGYPMGSPAPAEKKPETVLSAPVKKPVAKKAPARKPTRRPARGAAKVDVRKVVEKTLAVSELSEEDRDLIATILDTEKSTAEIVVAIIDGGTADGADEAIELSEIKDGGERGIRAATLGDSLKGVWAVYYALKLVPAEMPDATAKAALALIKAADKLADDSIARDRLVGAVETIR